MRLWITGTGLVTALGASTSETWERLVRGESGVGPVQLFDTAGQRTHLAAEASSVGCVDGDTSRTTRMALRAAREAMADAKLEDREPGARVGLIVAGTTGGMFETEAILAGFHADPGSREVLAQMLSHPLSAAADVMEAELGPFARVRTLSSACSGGAAALAVGAAWLLNGDVDLVIAGGSDALCRLTFTGFNALGASDPSPCRPFDRRRRGLTLGEGAGFVILERSTSAETRGARPIAELCGWAMGAEAHHITNPEASGRTLARLIAAALGRARLEASQIDYVNAHGTGTQLNDAMEAQALTFALGESIARIPVSSVKAQLGHTLGAAGAIEAVISALAIDRQMLPPTAGLEEPDPACALVHVANVGRSADVRAVVSNSFGFGGMDAVLVFGKPGFAPGHVASRRAVVVTGAAVLTPPALGGVLTVDFAHELDVARARRLDRVARLAVVVAGRARDASLAAGAAPDTARSGIILGSAFGSVDGCAAFMHRLFEKGPRLASPADFPNLVPSSPVGHASIYLGLRGPVSAVADLDASAESAFAAAVELVGAGDADWMIAGEVEEQSDLVEGVLVALFRDVASVAARSEGASAVIVEAEETARARGATVVASVLSLVVWRGADRPRMRAPSNARAGRVFAARGGPLLDSLLAGSGWEECARTTCEAAGGHEGLGGIAIAAAVAAIAAGEASEVLVMGLAKRRGYALVLGAP